MPVYEYECPTCEKVFEVQQKISDEALKNCPDCGGEVKKIVSMSSFQLKGGGWYSDGYSSPSSGSKNSKDKPAAKEPAPCAAGGCKNCPAAAK